MRRSLLDCELLFSLLVADALCKDGVVDLEDTYQRLDKVAEQNTRILRRPADPQLDEPVSLV